MHWRTTLGFLALASAIVIPPQLIEPSRWLTFFSLYLLSSVKFAQLSSAAVSYMRVSIETFLYVKETVLQLCLLHDTARFV